jgi:hypothetical protein
MESRRSSRHRKRRRPYQRSGALVVFFSILDMALIAAATVLAFTADVLTPEEKEAISNLWGVVGAVSSFLVGLLVGHLQQRN